MAQEPKIIYKTITITKDNWQTIMNDTAIQASLGNFNPKTDVIEIYTYEVKYEDFEPNLRFIVHNACLHLNSIDKEHTKKHEIKHWKNNKVLKNFLPRLNYYEQNWLVHIDEITARCEPELQNNTEQNIISALNTAVNGFISSYPKYIERFTRNCQYRIEKKLKEDPLKEFSNLFQQKNIYSYDFRLVEDYCFTINGENILNKIAGKDSSALRNMNELKRRSEQATEKLIQKILRNALTY